MAASRGGARRGHGPKRETVMKARSLLACGVLIATAGCSIFVPPDQAITISATDPGATLLVDGRSYGPGSRAVKMSRNQNHVVMAMAGTRTGTATVQPRLSSTGIMDIVGGLIWLVPFFGLATPGAWELDRDLVCVMVPPEPGAPPPPPALALPGPVEAPAAKPAPPATPRKPLDKRIRDESDYAWPNYQP